MSDSQRIEGPVEPRHLEVGVSQGYAPPALRRLGSLAELTQGGTTGPSDGFGGAGAQGSI